MTVPREFVFMDRAAIGLGGVFLHLDARQNWHDMFNETIEGFTLDGWTRGRRRRSRRPACRCRNLPRALRSASWASGLASNQLDRRDAAVGDIVEQMSCTFSGVLLPMSTCRPSGGGPPAADVLARKSVKN